MAGRARRGTVAVAVAVAVAATGGGFVWWWTGPRARAAAREAARAEASIALARLRRCLDGAEPDGPGAVARRMRRRALARDLAGEPSDWPARCEAHLDAFVAQLDALEASGADASSWSALRRHAGERVFLSAGVWRSPGADAARAALVDLLREADALSLPTPAADAVGDVPTPPAAPSLVEADALAALGEGGELFVERSGAPTFVVQRSGDDEVAVTACALRAEGDDLRCSATRTVEGRASFRPLRRAAGAPVLVADLFARAGEDTATWDAFASEARGSFASPAFVRADGSLHGVVLRERGKPPHGIIRGPGATASTETPFDAPFRGAVPTDALAASGVVAVRWEDPGKRTGTTLHPVHADGLGPPRLLDGPGALRALCPLSVGALLVRDLGDRWRVDVIAGDADPVRHELEPTVASDTERVAVRCRGGAVHLLERGPPRPGADGRDRTPLRRSRCDAEGCASTEGAVVRPRLAENARLALLDRDDTMLAVWAGRGAPAVALAAPLASLGDATPRLVMDDARHGGLAVVEPMLLPHRDGALLLLRTDDAVHAVALDAEGRPRPARVTAR